MNLAKDKAKYLRGKGYSYRMISEELGIARSTLSNWFKDQPFVPNKKVLNRIQYGPIKSAQRSHHIKVLEIEKLKAVGVKELGRLDKRDLWCLGLGLYIGEGSKSNETIRLINSNPAVVKLAIRWFKEVCGLENKNITMAIHIYPDNKEKECIEYWSNVTGLPKNNFRKTQVDRRTGKLSRKKGKLPYGTAHITIVSRGDPLVGVKLYRRINGWIVGALSQA